MFGRTGTSIFGEAGVVTAIRMSQNERRVVLTVALFWRDNSRAPTWKELRQALGIEHRQLVWTLFGMRKKRFIDFQDDVEVSLRVSAAAVQTALSDGGRT